MGNKIGLIKGAEILGLAGGTKGPPLRENGKKDNAIPVMIWGETYEAGRIPDDRQDELVARGKKAFMDALTRSGLADGEDARKTIEAPIDSQIEDAAARTDKRFDDDD